MTEVLTAIEHHFGAFCCLASVLFLIAAALSPTVVKTRREKP